MGISARDRLLRAPGNFRLELRTVPSVDRNPNTRAPFLYQVYSRARNNPLVSPLLLSNRSEGLSHEALKEDIVKTPHVVTAEYRDLHRVECQPGSIQ